MHARSGTYSPHESRHWLSRKHGEMGFLIPQNWRVCGENLYARHSIAYDNLQSYFYIFSIWDETNHALSWDDTLEWASLLGFPCVDTLYRGPFDAGIIASEQFNQVVAKWVRAGHVQGDEHWMHKSIVPNCLGTQERSLDGGFEP